MKKYYCLILIFISLLILLSCTSKNSEQTSTLSFQELPTKFLTATLVTPFLPTEPKEHPPHPTLQASDSDKKILETFQNATECNPMCFFGIIPDKTTYSEGIDLLTYYGFEHGFSTENSYAVEYGPKNGLDFSIILEATNEVIQYIQLIISPREKLGEDLKWSAFSPDVLISHYGNPSRVSFNLGTGEYSQSYEMILYFNSANLIAHYESFDIHYRGRAYYACPLLDHIDVTIWYGVNLDKQQNDGKTLEEMTGLGIDDFTKLMMGPKNSACFVLSFDKYED